MGRVLLSDKRLGCSERELGGAFGLASGFDRGEVHVQGSALAPVQVPEEVAGLLVAQLPAQETVSKHVLALAPSHPMVLSTESK